MTQTTTPKCFCGAALEQRPAGRRREYCSAACRQRAYRTRQLVPVPAAPHVAAEVQVQVQQAILEARTIGHAFDRLGRSAPPVLAGRCRGMGMAIAAALAAEFGV